MLSRSIRSSSAGTGSSIPAGLSPGSPVSRSSMPSTAAASQSGTMTSPGGRKIRQSVWSTVPSIVWRVKRCLEWLRILIRTSMKISRYILPILATAWIGSVSSRPFGDTLRMRDFGALPDSGEDASEALRKAVATIGKRKSPPYCVSSRGGTISMPLRAGRPGEHRGKTPRHSGFNNRRRWR